MKLAILQPHIPHYREHFFKGLSRSFPTDLYCYSLPSEKNNNFSAAELPTIDLSSIQKGPVLWYNPLKFLKSEYTHLVLMLHFGHITTWLLLLTRVLHRKKIILWGQGISVKRYIAEEVKPDWKLRLMIWLSQGVWLYTEKEMLQWKAIFKRKPIISLNNTLKTPSFNALEPKLLNALKTKYGITQDRILIFSARFENPYRRTDLLVDAIKALDHHKYGIIIIGDGSLKPDFTPFRHVYDFGKLYDDDVKAELFGMADIYFQPGWVGLSIVEAMRYSLPIFTLQRSEDIKQCVEYHYIIDRKNGRLFQSLTECITEIENLSKAELKRMGSEAQQLSTKKLTVENMVKNASRIIL